MKLNARKSTGITATAGVDLRASGCPDCQDRRGVRRRVMQSNAPAWKEAMRPLNYEVMFDVEDHHWWFVGRRAIVFSQIENVLGESLGTRTSTSIGGAEVSPESRIAQAAQEGQEIRILDLGWGTGSTLDHLKRYGQPHGIDLSELPLSFSRKRGHQRVLRASATELPFESDSFDLVTTLDVVEHLDNDVK